MLSLNETEEMTDFLKEFMNGNVLGAAQLAQEFSKKHRENLDRVKTTSFFDK